MLDLVHDVADDCEPHSEKKLSRVAIGDTILQQISSMICICPSASLSANTMASEHVGMAAQILQQAELALHEPEHVASSESCSRVY